MNNMFAKSLGIEDTVRQPRMEDQAKILPYDPDQEQQPQPESVPTFEFKTDQLNQATELDFTDQTDEDDATDDPSPLPVQTTPYPSMDMTPVDVKDTDYRVTTDMVNASKDLDIARNSLMKDMNLADQGVQSLVEFANQTQDPRIFDNLEKFLRLKKDQTTSLVDIHKTKQIAEDKAITTKLKQKKLDITAEQAKDKTPPVQQSSGGDKNVNIFVGSFADMQRAKKKMDEENIINHE